MKCVLCTDPCATCGCGTTECCESCDAPYFLKVTENAEDGTSVNECVEICPDGYYGNTDTRTCEPCKEACLTCANADQCTSCPDGSYLYDHQCGDCPAYHFGDDSDNTCYPCDPSCATCDEATFLDCTSCENDLFLYEGTCIKPCPDGYYAKTSTNTCELCGDDCDICEEDTSSELGYKCTDCAIGMFLKDNECVTYCGTDHFVRDDVCIPCEVPCESCISETECITCLPDYGYLYGTTCVNPCPAGYYHNDDYECVACHDTCLTCSGLTENDCVDCEIGKRWLYENTCLTECPDEYYGNDYAVCKDCNAACLTCVWSGSTQCTECEAGYY